MNLTSYCGRRRVTAGFSLMELMIAVAIIGILASIAMPSYVSHIARGKRAEVKGALQENAQFLETYYTTHGTTQGSYSTVKGSNKAPPLPVTRVPSSGTANYTITATVTNTSYTLTAKAVNSMVKDGCGNFTLTHTGAQGVSGKLGVAECWNR